MSNLGQLLKRHRETAGLSLQQVQKEIGITNSRLSRFERNEISCPASDLKRLARYYDVPVIPLFLEAGYLDEEDLIDYQYGFQGVSKLDKTEIAHIQSEIDFINRGRD